jgi:hypothetical protein
MPAARQPAAYDGGMNEAVELPESLVVSDVLLCL